MTEALAFWAVAVAIALIALPLAFRLFARFPDAGAGLAFSLGLTLVATGYFLLRVLDAIPAGRTGFVLAIALFALLMLLVAAFSPRFLATLRRALGGILTALALFSLLFFAYALYRAHVPDIAHTEQPMDFLYLNALLISPDYPPHDPWFAGERASYHYGGYLQAAVLTGVSGVWPASGYNLALAAVFAGAGTAAFTLAAAFARWLFRARARSWIALAGGGAVVLLLFAGSLASAFELASAHGAANERVYGIFGVEGLVRCDADVAPADCTGLSLAPTAAWYPDDHWVWWRMARMNSWGAQPAPQDAITESPAFSFILGDLHPHVMSIPGVLLALALCASLWRGRGSLSLRDHLRHPALFIVTALLFGALAFVNVWDVFAFSPLLALAVFARNLRANSPPRALLDALTWLLPPALLAVIAFSPWWIDFTPESGGIYAFGGRGTRIEHVLLMWGALILCALPFLRWAWTRRRAAPSPVPLLLALLPVLIPLLAWIILAAAGRTAAAFEEDVSLVSALAARTAGAWVALVLYAAAVWALSAAAMLLVRHRHPAAPLAALAALGVLLLYGAELLLLRDILYLPRLNTVFKLSYQAWIVLSIAGAVGIVAAVRASPPRLRLPLALPIVVLGGSALVFAVTSIPHRALGDSAGARAAEVTLDGLAYLKAVGEVGEYELVRWLNANAAPDAVVVEASGRTWKLLDGRPEPVSQTSAYGPNGRVADRTGLQIPIGWPHHELTWRGATAALKAEIARRQDLVDRVYTAPTPAEAIAAIEALGATYVVLGVVERDYYIEDLFPPFEDFLETVFEADGVTLYGLPREAPAEAP